jgi:hypothetical protein
VLILLSPDGRVYEEDSKTDYLICKYANYTIIHIFILNYFGLEIILSNSFTSISPAKRYINFRKPINSAKNYFSLSDK